MIFTRLNWPYIRIGLLVYLVCTSVAFAYGPYDYTNPVHVRDKLPIVEQYHFNADVEGLIRGMSTAEALGDLEYTINAFPNHHRALNALARYWHKYEIKGEHPKGRSSEKTPEFYFNRAIKFAPHDGTVKLIYAIHQHGLKRYQRALELYLAAESQILPGQAAELHYNLGLLYVDMKKYDQARQRAELAYGLGHPLPGLKNKLLKVGVTITPRKK